MLQVGSNADDLRARFRGELGADFKRFNKTKHYCAEVGSVKIWVATVDAAVDHQLRQHPSLAKDVRLHTTLSTYADG